MYFYNNRIVSTITIDINPSIKINLDKNNEVISVKAVNDDAKDIVSDDLKGKNVTDALKTIINNVVDKGYGNTGDVFVLVNTTGSLNKEEISNNIIVDFEEKGVRTEIITVDTISKEDEKIAKEYNISPAKAAYINSITDDIDGIDTEVLVNKPVQELLETKRSGNYCDDGYFLEGDFCLKEIGRTPATSGKICPTGYYDYNGTCYEEKDVIVTGKLLCNDNDELKDNKCINIIEDRAIPSKYECSKGEAKTRLELGLSHANDGDANDVTCVDYSKATHPVSPCEANDGTEYTRANGKCYWHRAPVIAAGCPGKIKVNGFCWDDATGIYICPGYRDGKQYKSRDEYCEHSIKYTEPIVTEYICEDGFTLEGNKCIKEELYNPYNEIKCSSEYNLVDNGRCIDTNKTKKKIDGYICTEENSKVEGSECIIYDIKEAKH